MVNKMEKNSISSAKNYQSETIIKEMYSKAFNKDSNNINIAKLSGGLKNAVYLIEDDGKKVVLKSEAERKGVSIEKCSEYAQKLSRLVNCKTVFFNSGDFGLSKNTSEKTESTVKNAVKDAVYLMSGIIFFVCCGYTERHSENHAQCKQTCQSFFECEFHGI